MYKHIDFTQLDGIFFSQDVLKFLQESYREALGAAATFLGNNVIITGVELSGGSYSNGWVVINGEILPFVGGLAATHIIVEEVTSNELFEDSSNKPVYITRRAKLASSGGTAISSFVRLETALALKQGKAPLVSPEFSGTPIGPTAAPGTDTTQLATTAFVKAALTALLGGAAFTGAVIGTSAEFVNGIRFQNSGPYLKTKVIEIGDWNMNVSAGGSGDDIISVAHGLDWSKIRAVDVRIRADDNAAVLKSLNQYADVGTGDYGHYVTASNVFLIARAGGDFDNDDYNSTSYNRGYITITYEA